MTKIAQSAYVSAITVGCTTIADAVDRDPRRPVPSCGGWDVADLGRHLGSLYVRVAEQVRRESAEAVPPGDLPAPPEGEGPLLGRWLRESADGLVAALFDASDDAPSGRWRDRTVPPSFWRRRMAHETLVHQVDAADAVGGAVTLDGELAADGVDEALELFLPSSTRADRWPPSGLLCLRRSDGPEQWWIEPGKDQVQTSRHAPAGLSPTGELPTDAVSIEAPAEELFLVCWGRRRPPLAGTTGRDELVDHWLSVLGW